MNQPSPSAKTDTLDIGALTTDANQERQSDRIEKSVFGRTENGLSTGRLITQFIASYERYKLSMPLDVWLSSELGKHSGVWNDQSEIASAAKEIIDSVQHANDAKESLYSHLGSGKSKESWLARNIEQGATAAGVSQVADYALAIDRAIATANKEMLGAVTNLDGSLSASPNLDGFIAEQHHVDTFNLDAASRGSAFHAKVLNPEGQPYGANSVDIGIYDGQGHLVRRYQAKYGKDAAATEALFDRGDYRGQRKLVPGDQVGKINGSSDIIEFEGIKSKPLTKEQAKALQESAQKAEEIEKYQWNDVNRINIAKSIGKQALVGAGIAVCMHGSRILGRRIWNAITNRDNPPASEDLKEFFESSIKSCAHVGVQVAVSGAVVVAAKSGFLGTLIKGTPVGRIANAVYVGMENAKILYKFAKGELSGAEALDAMGNVTTSAVAGIYGATLGMAKGAALGTVFGPVGTVVGGVVGGIVGGMAGSKIGEAVYEGGKALLKSAGNLIASVADEIKNTAAAALNVLNPLKWLA